MGKRKSQMGWTGLLLLCLWLAGVRALWAQDNPVTAQVDRTTVGSNETVTLSVIVSGANGGQPTLPTLDGFQIVSTSTASQFSMVNGQTSAQTTYQYLLQPTRTGELQIPAISVTVDGQSYQTAPITVQVTQGAAPSQPATGGQPGPAASADANRDFFIEGSVDQPEVYLGQQVTYNFRFYQAVTLFDQPSYKGPDFTGFWHDQKSDQTQAMAQVDGRNYQVTTLQTILFPTVPGVQTISPATLSIPGGLFQRDTVLQTQPITVTVKPLPEPAPADFSGAVGQVTITATVSANTVAVNEPVTLRVGLHGPGNAANWPDPTLPTLTGWRKFDSTTKTTSQVENGRLLGSRTYEQLLIPTTAGQATIPALTYRYFDPEQGTYQSIQTPVFTITVTAAAAEAPIPTVAAAQGPVTVGETDIRHIKQAPPTLRMGSQPLTSQPLYWATWALPVLVLGADWLWQRRRQRQASDPVQQRRAQAHKKARQALSQARKSTTTAQAVVGSVLTDYLSAKMNQPVVGLTQTLLAERLRSQGLSPELIAQVNQVLARSEMARFAPTSAANAGAESLLAETEALINNLEKVL